MTVVEATAADTLTDPLTGGQPVARPFAAGWRASLRLAVEPRGQRTVIAQRRHQGPLMVQRAFFEEDGSCQIYLLHPPGGIVGGDRLRLEVEARSGARALLTTPAATKLYRSPAHVSEQRIQLSAEPGAALEWLPQETIVYQGARSRTLCRVALRGDAQFSGWEIVCLGQDNRGLLQGELAQSYRLSRDGRPLWSERTALSAGSPLLAAPWGLSGRSVVGTFVTSGAKSGHVDALRERGLASSSDAGSREGWTSVTLLGEVLVCRYLGYSAEAAKRFFCTAWGIVRPDVSGRRAAPPRVWST